MRSIGLTLLIVVGALQLAAADEPAREKKVLYIGIDGCRFDALRKAETPNLDALMEEGCWHDGTLILGDRYRENDTISGPGWSTILTGVWADKHGVNDNQFRGKNYDEYPHFFTRLKEVRPDAYTISVVTWLPIQDHIVRDADEGIGVAPVNARYGEADLTAARTMAELLKERDPTAAFYYIANVDETGHRYGFHPTVPEYIAAIEDADRLVGQVVDAVRSRSTYDKEDWLILVTSDHGGQGRGHSGGHDDPEVLNSFSIVSGRGALRGRMEGQPYLVDVPVTALAFLGVPLDPEWKLDGRPIGLREE